MVSCQRPQQVARLFGDPCHTEWTLSPGQVSLAVWLLAGGSGRCSCLWHTVLLHSLATACKPKLFRLPGQTGERREGAKQNKTGSFFKSTLPRSPGTLSFYLSVSCSGCFWRNCWLAHRERSCMRCPPHPSFPDSLSQQGFSVLFKNLGGAHVFHTQVISLILRVLF